MKRFTALIVSLPMTFIGCGGSFDLNSIKGQVTEKIPEPKVKEIQAMKKQSVSSLEKTDQDNVAQIVFHQLYSRTNLMKLGSLVCHIEIGLPAGKKCVQERDRCMEEVNKAKEAGIKDAVKRHEKTIKDYVKTSQAQPEFFVAAFDTLNAGLNAAADVDCGSSEAEQNKILEDLQKRVASKYGQDKVEPIEAVIRALLRLGAGTSLSPN